MKQIHVTGVKRGKTRTAKLRLILVLHLIGREGGESFFKPTTERSKAKPKQFSDYFRQSIENRMSKYVNHYVMVYFKLIAD